MVYVHSCAVRGFVQVGSGSSWVRVGNLNCFKGLRGVACSSFHSSESQHVRSLLAAFRAAMNLSLSLPSAHLIHLWMQPACLPPTSSLLTNCMRWMALRGLRGCEATCPRYAASSAAWEEQSWLFIRLIWHVSGNAKKWASMPQFFHKTSWLATAMRCVRECYSNPPIHLRMSSMT